MQSEDFDFEIRRKFFHLCGIIFPLSYLFISKMTFVTYLLIIAGFILSVDIYRYYNQKVQEFTDVFFYKYLRKKQKNYFLSISAPSYAIIGLLLSCLFFSKELAITSWFILIVADSVAALFGIRYGVPLKNGKSLFGMGAFFFTSIFISVISYFFVHNHTNFIIIVLSSVVATLTEFYEDRVRIDDNLLIPLSYCITTFILGFVL